MKNLMKKSLSVMLTVLMVISVMPSTMISFATEASVDYINENGVTATQTATELTGSETVLDGGWYVINGDVTFDHDLNGNGDVKLILAEGSTLSFEGTSQFVVNNTGATLSIFSQDHGGFLSCGYLGSNVLNIYGGYFSGQTVAVSQTVSIYGGGIMLTDGNGLLCMGDVNILGGDLYVAGEYASVMAGFMNTNGGNITLGRSALRDSINSVKYEAYNGSVIIADGQTLHDGNGNFYSGTLTADEISAVGGKSLQLAQFATVTWKNADGTVLETDTDVLCAFDMPEYNGQTPTMADDANYSYTFRGWSAAIQPIEGDTVYTADYTKIKKNVSYVDANGDTQTVNATVLDGGESGAYYDYSSTYFVGEENTTSWYVVESDVVYDDSLSTFIRIRGDVNLIIEDGASLTVDGFKTPYNDSARTLSIYGQGEGTGEIVTDIFDRYYQFDELNIYGCSVTVGRINNIDTVNILSGNTNVTESISADAITLGCRTFSDSITINSIDLKSYTVTASVVSGHSLVDTNRNYYTGDLSYQQISDISGVTLTLHDEHAYSAPEWQWSGTNSSNWNAEAIFRCSVCNHVETVSTGSVKRTVIQKANYNQNWIRRVTKTVTFNGETYQTHKDDERGIFDFAEINGEVAVTGFRGYNGVYSETVITDVTVPDVVPDFYPDESLRGRPITVIATSAFAHERATPSVNYTNRVHKLTLGNNVTIIEDGTFENCAQLAEVSVGTGLTSIGSNAFKDCDKLTKFTCTSLNTVTCSSNSVPSGVAFYGPHAGGIKAVAQSTGNLFYGTNTHSFGTPEWTWSADCSAATVSFACASCDYADTLDATVTSEITTPNNCAYDGLMTYTATVTVNETEYNNQTTAAIPATGGHTLTHHPYTEQTDVDYGNTEYWSCDVCGKYFADENCLSEIALADTVILPNLRILTPGEVYEIGEPVVLDGKDCLWYIIYGANTYRKNKGYNIRIDTGFDAGIYYITCKIDGVNDGENRYLSRVYKNNPNPFTGLYQCVTEGSNLDHNKGVGVFTLYYDMNYAPEWNWSADGRTATLTLRHFASDYGTTVNYVQTLNARVTYVDDFANGKRIYTATVDDYNMNFTDTFEVSLNSVYDVNDDGVMDINDIAFIISAFVGDITVTASQQAKADIDGDGVIDCFDAAELDRILFGNNSVNGDVDSDGDIDLTDYALVKAYISGEDLDTEHPSDLLDKSYLPAEYDLIKANFDDGVIITPAFYAADYNGDKAVDAFDLFSLDKRLNNIT